MNVAVLGGGNGAYAAAADLSLAGHRVRLWRRNGAELQAVRDAGRGVCGADIITVSLGQAYYPVDGPDAEQLLAEADRRMYKAKLKERKVRGYETRHHARATVIGRIDKLCEDQPWPGYDEMNLDEILPKARELPAEEQTKLVSYERRHKNRRTIVDTLSRVEAF